jgi:hypothetical protein
LALQASFVQGGESIYIIHIHQAKHGINVSASISPADADEWDFEALNTSVNVGKGRKRPITTQATDCQSILKGARKDKKLEQQARTIESQEAELTRLKRVLTQTARTNHDAAHATGQKAKRFKKSSDVTHDDAHGLIHAGFAIHSNRRFGVEGNKLRAFMSELADDIENQGLLNVLRYCKNFRLECDGNLVAITIDTEFDGTMQPISGHATKYCTFDITVLVEVLVQTMHLTISLMPAGSDEVLSVTVCGKIIYPCAN